MPLLDKPTRWRPRFTIRTLAIIVRVVYEQNNKRTQQ